MAKQFRAALNDPGFVHRSPLPDFVRWSSEYRETMKSVLDQNKAAVKFMLPEGGKLLDDKEYKALDENIQLRLPYKAITLEYYFNKDVQNINLETLETHEISSKRIIFCYEEKNEIVILPVYWNDESRYWFAFPQLKLPTIGYLDRTRKSELGRAAIKCIAHDKHHAADCHYDLIVLLDFLNALQCANVKIARSRAYKKTSKKALKYDDYHILIIGTNDRRDDKSGCAHNITRQKREHLRRGHIRRYKSGLKIWVNATIVNPNKNCGTVHKDYRMRAMQ